MIKRIKEAVSEIKKTARKNPVLRTEGVVLFLENISSAIEQVDSSWGAICTTVNKAIDSLVPIVAKATADGKLRDKWLERLYGRWKMVISPTSRCFPTIGERCVSFLNAPHAGRRSLLIRYR